MSNEEKLKRDRHQKVRKTWSNVFFVALIVFVVLFVALFVANYKSKQLIYLKYSEKCDVNYQVNLLDNEFYDEVDEGQAYPANYIDTIDTNFKYKLEISSKEVNYKYSYKIVKYIQYSNIRNGNFHPASMEILSEKAGSSKSLDGLNLNEKVSFSYKTTNEEAKNFLLNLQDSTVQAFVYVTMEIEVKSSCDDFLTENVDTQQIVFKMQLTEPTTNAEITSKSSNADSKMLACTRAGSIAKITKIAMIVDGSLVLIMASVLILFLQATKNKDVDYALKIKRILRSYRTYIQVSLVDFDCKEYKLVKLGKMSEMLEIRDTLQKPIIMKENEDRTHSKFFIVDNNVLYLYEICVEGYENLLTNGDVKNKKI